MRPVAPGIAPSTSGMTDNALVLLALIALSGWIGRQWLVDYRAALGGRPSASPLPGATPAPGSAVAIAALGSVVILALETAGERSLGLTATQSSMTVLFGLYSIAGASIIEELVFRGYLIIEGRGRAVLWGGVVATSLLFAVSHAFLWDWDGQSLTWQLGPKAWFSTATVFVMSLWFYAVRVFRLNPGRSLLPCFAAHATKNLGVFGVKYVQGFVHGWW